MLDHTIISESCPCFIFKVVAVIEQDQGEVIVHPLIVANVLHKSALPDKCRTNDWKDT